MAERDKQETHGKSASDIMLPMEKKYTDNELARIASWVERYKRQPVKFAPAKSDSGKLGIKIPEADGLLDPTKMMEALGTHDPDLQNLLLNQVVQTFRWYQTSEGYNYENMAECCNLAMAILQGVAPRDEIEGMLAIQMVGVHNLAMETMRRAMVPDQPFEGVQANVNHATKMLRTFMAQMETLKRYRTGGQQKVTVEHVHVNQGGKAIVGAVTQAGGGCAKRRG